MCPNFRQNLSLCWIKAIYVGIQFLLGHSVCWFLNYYNPKQQSLTSIILTTPGHCEFTVMFLLQNSKRSIQLLTNSLLLHSCYTYHTTETDCDHRVYFVTCSAIFIENIWCVRQWGSEHLSSECPYATWWCSITSMYSCQHKQHTFSHCPQLCYAHHLTTSTDMTAVSQSSQYKSYVLSYKNICIISMSITYKTFGSIIHILKLKPLLLLKCLS